MPIEFLKDSSTAAISLFCVVGHVSGGYRKIIPNTVVMVKCVGGGNRKVTEVMVRCVGGGNRKVTEVMVRCVGGGNRKVTEVMVRCVGGGNRKVIPNTEVMVKCVGGGNRKVILNCVNRKVISHCEVCGWKEQKGQFNEES